MGIHPFVWPMAVVTVQRMMTIAYPMVLESNPDNGLMMCATILTYGIKTLASRGEFPLKNLPGWLKTG